MKSHRLSIHHLALVGLTAAFAACGTHGGESDTPDATDNHAAALRQSFPKHAAEVLQQETAFISGAEGMTPGGAAAGRSLELTLPYDGASPARMRWRAASRCA